MIHNDIRSDNLRFLGRRLVQFDWAAVSRGSIALDLAGFLPSVEAEGGPGPEDLAHLPRLRAVQLAQLVPALAWVARLLSLPAPPPLALQSP